MCMDMCTDMRAYRNVHAEMCAGMCVCGACVMTSRACRRAGKKLCRETVAAIPAPARPSSLCVDMFVDMHVDMNKVIGSEDVFG